MTLKVAFGFEATDPGEISYDRRGTPVQHLMELKAVKPVGGVEVVACHPTRTEIGWNRVEILVECLR